MVTRVLGVFGLAAALTGCGGDPNLGSDSQAERYISAGAAHITQAPVETRPITLDHAARTQPTSAATRACGALVIYSQADITEAQHCDSAESLTVETTKDLQDIGLPNLTKVAGTVEVHGANVVERLRLPALHSVGGSFLVYGNPSLLVVAVGSLTTVGGDVQLIGNPLFDELNFGNIRHIGGGLIVVDNPGLCVARGAMLQSHVEGAVEISDNMRTCQ